MKNSFAFQLAMHEVRRRDTRYAPEAYAFLFEALEHTVQKLGRHEQEDHHVAGPELLMGFRELAIQEFGPMAWYVMSDWGIRCSEDVGNMVYNFIEVSFFGKNENDKLEDFSDGVGLQEALCKPFQRQAD